MRFWILGYLLALGCVVGVNAVRVRRAGARPFPFLRSSAATAHGLLEKVLIVVLAAAGLYVVAWVVRPSWIEAVPRLALPPWAAAVGVLLLAPSLALAALSVLWMGPSWRIGIDETPQAVVVTGPYRVIRHPIYAGMLLAVAGMWLAGPDVLVSLWAGAAAVALLVQARLEEEFLAKNAPGYSEYMKRTGRFVPRIGRARS